MLMRKFITNTFYGCIKALKSIGVVMRQRYIRRKYCQHIPSTARQSISTVTTFLEIDSNTESGKQFLREYTENIYNENLEELSKCKPY
ncbi:hypothetical protein QE152_g532 [Popillia japonica]|uniref:Uncharacterized protein n=1 Tax=Popillia japonica TaxID=7064 RepID=A0AAW1N984_POPJA